MAQNRYTVFRERPHQLGADRAALDFYGVSAGLLMKRPALRRLFEVDLVERKACLRQTIAEVTPRVTAAVWWSMSAMVTGNVES